MSIYGPRTCLFTVILNNMDPQEGRSMAATIFLQTCKHFDNLFDNYEPPEDTSFTTVRGASEKVDFECFVFFLVLDIQIQN